MTVQEALDRCIDEIRSGGASVEDCLRRYPEHSRELAPLLRMTLRLQSAGEVRASRAYKERLRAQLTGEEKARRKSSSRARIVIWLALALVLAILVWLGIAFAFYGHPTLPVLPLTYLAPSLPLCLLLAARPSG